MVNRLFNEPVKVGEQTVLKFFRIVSTHWRPTVNKTGIGMRHERAMLPNSNCEVSIFVVGISTELFVELLLFKDRPSERHCES
jgi:hypothetical protein